MKKDMLRLPRIIRSGEAAFSDIQRDGGKGAALLDLDSRAYPVPPFFIIGTEVLRGIKERAGSEFSEILREINKALREDEGNQKIEALACRASEILISTGLEDADREQIFFEFDLLFGKDSYVAVRSSVVGEDSQKDSFAGQMDTYLFVSRENLEESIISCLASAFKPGVFVYRKLRGLSSENIESAAVVQKMIDSSVSGVAFTANPVSKDRGEALISAVPGLGEGLVSGHLNADTFVVNRRSRTVVRSDIVEKSSKVVFSGNRKGGLAVIDIEAGKEALPSLSEEQVMSVLDMAERIEAESGLPQDMEWTIDAGGKLHLLQSRPLTSLPVESGHITIFDNANIVESYPGISSPLTFSFVRKSYEAAFREGLYLLAGKTASEAVEKKVLENLIGLVEGRIYYNILNWYRMFQYLGMDKALPTFEKTLGIDDSYRPDPPEGKERLYRLHRDARVRTCLLLGISQVNARAEKFLKDLEEVRSKFFSLDLDSLEAHELIDLFEYCSGKLAAPYGVAIANDFYAQHFHEFVRKLLELWGFSNPDSLRNRLMTGEEGMQSVDPLRSMLNLCSMIRSSSELHSLFKSDITHEEIWRKISGNNEFRDFYNNVRRHIDLYGDRTVHELKLETPTMEDCPELVVATLRNFLGSGREYAFFDHRNERMKAEQEVRKGLLFHPLRRALFTFVLRRARAGLRNRENLRLARSRGFGLVKKIFRALGERLAAEALIERPEDIFMLTVEEVTGAVRGHAVTKNLHDLVRLRKEEYERYRNIVTSQRIEVQGPVSAFFGGHKEGLRAGNRDGISGLGRYGQCSGLPGNREQSARHAAYCHKDSEHGQNGAEKIPSKEKRLYGTGCCPGVVRAKARVVKNPRHDMVIRDEILVAPMTDPGWVFLMAAAKGLVVERGSLLSHTAIIGRELGVPTIVSVKEATGIISDGMLIEIDGAAGSVRLIDEKDETG